MTVQANEAGAGAQEFYSQIVGSLTSGVIAVDHAGTIVTANPAACAHLHIPPEVLHAGASFDGIPALQQFAAVLEELKQTQHPVSRRELTVQTAEGNKVIGLTASLLQGPQAFNGVTFLFIDLTEIHQLRRVAELNRQLAQIGELTAGVVHELRNPLSVISGMAELLMRKLGEGNEHQKKARIIFDEAGQLERLISQFLSFARPYYVEATASSTEEIVERAVRLTERLAEQRQVEVRVDWAGSPPYLEADSAQLPLALANLLRNAIEIVEKSTGRVLFRIGEEAGHVLFRVEDNGLGIHLAAGEELFTAFLTKKEGGTGLGLAIVHRIVAAHHGQVTYGNRPEGGAWFEIRLPKKQPASPAG